MSALRYLAALVVLLALQFAPGSPVIGAVAAHDYKQDSCYSNSYNGSRGCTRAQAYAQAEAHRLDLLSSGIAKCAWFSHDPNAGNYSAVTYEKTCGGSNYDESGYWVYDAECQAGATWQSATNTCFSSAECLAKPPLGFTKVTAASSWDSVCSDGCSYSQNTALDIQFPQADGTVMGFTTGWEPTGDACAVGDPTPQPVVDPQYCEPDANGGTFCVKSSGEHCYSLPVASGNQICWRPGETGEKTSGPALQVRNAGGQPATPETLPPAGDTFAQNGTPTTKTAAVNGTTITTTTTNYTTVNGTDAGTTDSGEPGDGTGSGAGDGDGTDPWDVSGMDMSEGDAAPTGESLWAEDAPVGLDESGFLSSRSCPAPIEITLAGMTKTIDTSGLCDLGAVIGALVILMGLAQSAWVMGEA